MLFSSMTFIFIFLPVVSAVYLLSRPEVKNYVLLLASLLFYAWGEPKYLAIMLLTIVINYAGAYYISRSNHHKKALLAATILLDLSFLFYFKYFNFVTDNINALFHAEFDFIDVIMPIGISFYTFQALSYVVDVYRGEVKAQKDVYKLALYITLFPQLVAGPIVKYHDVEEQIDKRDVTFDKVSYGVKRFIIGLAKKMLIANTLGAVADKIFNQPVENFDVLTAWIGAFAYTFQLYYDFSGYSDMAIGLGAIFGFKFLENFNYPYIAKSITEFWRRWHISLTSWFTEYVYISLGGNRVSQARWILNISLVFLLSGIWHGATWSFVLWGAMHAVFYLVERFWGPKRPNILYHLLVFVMITFAWIFFRIESSVEAWHVVTRICSDIISPVYWGSSTFSTLLTMLLLGIFMLREYLMYRNILPQKSSWEYLFLLLAIGLFGVSSDQFVYFQF